MRQPWNILLMGALAVTLLGCFASANLDEAFDDSNPESDGGGDGGSDCKTNGDCTDGFACNTATQRCFDDCDGNDQRCAETHYCVGQVCVEKKTNGEDCAVAGECASNYCDATYGICCISGGSCCRDQNDCSGTTPICSTDNQCVACTAQDSCGDQYPNTPVCKTGVGIGAGSCVECMENDDCQTDGGVPALSSPLGLCTDDNVCTCWVETEEGNCPDTDYCIDKLGSDFFCASDYVSHSVCLRACGTGPVGPVNGVACELRNTDGADQYVWTPMTSCYAFNEFGVGCSDNDDCSIRDSAPFDGLCQITCSYLCGSSDECPQGSTCSTWCQ